MDSFKTLQEQAKVARDAYWAILNRLDQELSPKLAGFFRAIGLLQAMLYEDTTTYDNACDALRLKWRYREGGEFQEQSVDLTERNLVRVLLEEPEKCFEGEEVPRGFQAKLASTARKFNLDLKAVAEYLDGHNLTVDYQMGLVQLAGSGR